MKFAATFLGLFAATAAAKLDINADVKADSKLGKRLLSKAKVVTPARHLEQQERENYFLAGYDIKYQSCSSLIQVNGEEGGGDDESILYAQNLIKFSLCPSDTCSDSSSYCSGGGEYVVNMLEFLDAYTEAKLEEQEMACENIRENCYCNNNYNDDEQCENQCYVEAGMEECIEYEGQEEFEIQRYLECAEMENQNGNDNNNNNGQNNYYNGDNNNFYGQYYVGAYCSPKDGKSILMGVFYDAGCVNKAESSIFADYNYGQALPFADEPIITHECISCKQVDYDNNNNNNNNGNNNNGNYYNQDYEITELCEQGIEQAAACEVNMDINYQDNRGCDYINNILPRLDSASRGVYGGGGSKSSSASTASTALAWVFAATTILFGAYAYFLYRKIKRGSVNLSSQDGAMA